MNYNWNWSIFLQRSPAAASTYSHGCSSAWAGRSSSALAAWVIALVSAR